MAVHRSSSNKMTVDELWDALREVACSTKPHTKGKPKSTKHIQAIKDAWTRKRLLASSKGKTTDSDSVN